MVEYGGLIDPGVSNEVEVEFLDIDTSVKDQFSALLLNGYALSIIWVILFALIEGTNPDGHFDVVTVLTVDASIAVKNVLAV